MAKYTSGRQKNLKVGLTSYSENKTSLEVIGKVGIGTTNATSSLHVVGNTNISGIVTVGVGSTGIVIDGTAGIITSSNPGFSTVTYFGNLTGTASSATFATSAGSLNGSSISDLKVGFATTATNVIGGIASVTSLFVDISGISTLGTVVISSGIITSSNPGFSTVTYFGNLTGTASSATFATSAGSLNGSSISDLKVGFATTATNVSGGIASVSQLSVSGVSTVGVLTASKIGIGTTNPTSELFVIGNTNISGIVTVGVGSTGVLIDGVNGIVTSTNPGVTTVAYFGNLRGNSDTTGKLKNPVNIGGVSFDGSASISLKGVNTKGDQDTDGTAASASNLSFGVSKGIYFRDTGGTNAITSSNFTFDGNNLKVSGITTVGSGDNGIRIDGTTGIISSSNPGFTTVTFVGNLIGTAQVDVTNVTNTSNVIGGIASVTALSVSGLSTVGILTATKIGIGTTNPTSELFVSGNIFVSGISTLSGIKISSGIVTGTSGIATFFGDFVGSASSVIGGIASVSQLSVSGFSTVGVLTVTKIGIGTTNPTSELFVNGNIFVSGVSTLSGIKISSGIVTGTSGIATFFGDFVGSASTASFATTAFNLNSPLTTKVGFATTAIDVIGGIGSLTQLSVSGFSTVGILTATKIGIGTTNPTSELFVSGNIFVSGISTLSGIKISSGIVTSTNTGIAVTFFGDFVGTASSAGFAQTAFNLDSSASTNIRVGFATTATNVIGGIGSLTQLSVSGFSTVGVLTATKIGIGTTNPTSELFVVGNSRISGIVTVGSGNSAVVIDGTAGIITSSGVGTVTYFGNLTGTASSATFATSAGSLNGSSISDLKVGFATTATNVSGGIGSLTQLSVSGFSTVGVLTATKIGIGTTNPTSELFVVGNAVFGGTGIVTASKYNGDLVFGTPSGTGFKSGPVTITSTSSTRDSVNDINFILGKLLPKAPKTIVGAALTLTSLQPAGNQTRLLCGGFVPTNNDPTTITGIASGNAYLRNNTRSVNTLTLQRYGPGDSGTVTALLNFGNGVGVGVGTTTLSPLSSGSNNGTFGSLVISNDQDASITGIVSGFYEVYDTNITNATCPSGFNSICIRHVDGSNTYTTTKPFWYEDPSTVSAPVLSAGTVSPPSDLDHVVSLSSGIPHYTESASNAFTYVLTCQNATGDMYSSNTFCTGGSATSGFQASGNKSYTDFTNGSNPPTRNFGVGTGVTTPISQTPQNTHIQLVSPVSFSSYTASTPYGTSNTPSVTLSKSINIMGSTAVPDTKVDETNISVNLLGLTSPFGSRTVAISGVDNPVTPTPYTISWDENLLLIDGNSAGYEAVVVGGVLKHDLTNYTTFLPVGPDYSTGRSASQYFQFAFTRSPVLKFGITIACDTSAYSGCWVSQPNNANWKTALNGSTNGWASMFAAQSGTPSNASPGCALAGVMNGSSGTFNCTFGTLSSSDGGGLIVVRFKLNSAKSITSIKIVNSTQ